MNQSPPMGRMLRRAISDIESNSIWKEYYGTISQPVYHVTTIPWRDKMTCKDWPNATDFLKEKFLNKTVTAGGQQWEVFEIHDIEFNPAKDECTFKLRIRRDLDKPIGRSLNTAGVQYRVRQLEWDCIRFRKGLGELYTPDEQNAHLAKPVTKKDILHGYLRAGHYFNNKTPRL